MSHIVALGDLLSTFGAQIIVVEGLVMSNAGSKMILKVDSSDGIFDGHFP